MKLRLFHLMRKEIKMSNIKWDAEEYSDHFSFVPQYGSSLIDMIDIREGMTGVDLGCGNGVLTARLKAAGIDVIGIDDSPEQIRAAEKNYPAIKFIRENAVDFVLKEPVDVIFSNAVFHWIDKKLQPAMLKSVYRALKPGGQCLSLNSEEREITR